MRLYARFKEYSYKCTRICTLLEIPSFLTQVVGQESRERVVAQCFLLRVVGQVHLRIRVNACSRSHIEGLYARMQGATESADTYVIPAMQRFREDS